MTLHLTKTRTYLELRVGSNACVEVLLYLRQADLAWFNNNDDDKNDTHTTDLFQVLEQSVLPRMMPQEIEDLHYKHNRETTQPPPLGPGGIPILVGHDTKNNNNNNNGKKQSNAKKAGGNKRKRLTAKEKATAAFQEEQAKQDSKRQKDVYYAFGETLQLAYKWEDIGSKGASNNSALFVFRNNDDDDDASNNNNGNDQNQGILCQLDKLPKRIVAWVFPFDPSKPTQVDPADGGFPLPERIPIAHLFRGGGGGGANADDEDDEAQAKA